MIYYVMKPFFRPLIDLCFLGTRLRDFQCTGRIVIIPYLGFRMKDRFACSGSVSALWRLAPEKKYIPQDVFSLQKKNLSNFSLFG